GAMTVLDPTGILSTTAQSRLYPNFDAGSFLYFARIGGYLSSTQSGRSYLTLRAQDADGTRDNRIDDPRPIVAAVDGGTGTPQQIEMRKAILTYYVNYSPFLRTGEPGFVPVAGQVFPGRTL